MSLCISLVQCRKNIAILVEKNVTDILRKMYESTAWTCKGGLLSLRRSLIILEVFFFTFYIFLSSSSKVSLPKSEYLFQKTRRDSFHACTLPNRFYSSVRHIKTPFCIHILNMKNETKSIDEMIKEVYNWNVVEGYVD